MAWLCDPGEALNTFVSSQLGEGTGRRLWAPHGTHAVSSLSGGLPGDPGPGKGESHSEESLCGWGPCLLEVRTGQGPCCHLLWPGSAQPPEARGGGSRARPGAHGLCCPRRPPQDVPRDCASPCFPGHPTMEQSGTWVPFSCSLLSLPKGDLTVPGPPGSALNWAGAQRQGGLGRPGGLGLWRARKQPLGPLLSPIAEAGRRCTWDMGHVWVESRGAGFTTEDWGVLPEAMERRGVGYQAGTWVIPVPSALAAPCSRPP